MHNSVNESSMLHAASSHILLYIFRQLDRSLKIKFSVDCIKSHHQCVWLHVCAFAPFACAFDRWLAKQCLKRELKCVLPTILHITFSLARCAHYLCCLCCLFHFILNSIGSGVFVCCVSPFCYGVRGLV